MHKQKNRKLYREVAYCITSRTAKETSPKRLMEINRSHWAIENSCHYIPDGTSMRAEAAFVPETAGKCQPSAPFFNVYLRRKPKPAAA